MMKCRKGQLRPQHTITTRIHSQHVMHLVQEVFLLIIITLFYFYYLITIICNKNKKFWGEHCVYKSYSVILLTIVCARLLPVYCTV